jgi:hypothetical protein
VAVTGHHPDIDLVVAVDGDVVRVHDGPAPAGAARCEGQSVELLEMLSTRDVGRPVPHEIGLLTAGLATVFDQPSPV